VASMMSGEWRSRLGKRHSACALIAVKQREHCKTRLARTLAPSSHLQLVRSMLTAVLSAAGSASTVRRVMVVSPERDTVPLRVPVLVDTGESLNDALMQAYKVLRERGEREIVILPADLPTITPDEIDALVRAARSGGCAMASDEARVGTNALSLVSERPFCFKFGPDSLRLHLQEADRAGLNARVVSLPGLEFDVDSPADLNRLERQWLARRRA
jgi:2-phospho-L-lactate guanylyltransferase